MTTSKPLPEEAVTAIADFLVNQSDEPWAGGTESDRVHYWRDKAIGAAYSLRKLVAMRAATQPTEAVRLGLEDADSLERMAEEADDNNWQDWAALMRQSAKRIRDLAGTATQPATSFVPPASLPMGQKPSTAIEVTSGMAEGEDRGARTTAVDSPPQPTAMPEEEVMRLRLSPQGVLAPPGYVWEFTDLGNGRGSARIVPTPIPLKPNVDEDAAWLRQLAELMHRTGEFTEHRAHARRIERIAARLEDSRG